VAIFVDTGAWYAASVPTDPDHVTASAYLRSNRERLVATDYIYDELLTLFRARSHTDRAQDWVNQVRKGRCEIIRITDADLLNATEVFFRFADKQWSFTDCTSRVIMQRLGIQRAFTFDEHFRQFGTVAVVP
jgi:uncharacterized protein